MYKIFKDSKEYFSYIDLMLENNIKINKANGLKLYFSNGDIIELLEQRMNPKKYHLPKYDDETVINIISGIRNNYGFDYKYKFDLTLFDKKYDHIVYLLLDGLGVNVLNKTLTKTSFLRTHYYKKINAIYPSTTSAATISAKSGLYPLESGWTGWQNYIKEANKNLILFTGVDYYSKEKTGININKLLPFKPFFHDMNLGRIIEPDFSKKYTRIDSLFKQSLKTLENDKFQYIYYNYPDEILHIDGIYGKATKEKMKSIDKFVESYANRLPDNTLLIISADHGHTSCNPLDISEFKSLNNLLERKISNDARCATFKVKCGKTQEFEDFFNLLFKKYFILYDSNDLIKERVFGDFNGLINERIDDFLADYVAIAISDKYFKLNSDNVIFKSHHAGITDDEMYVPLIVYKK